MAGFDYSAFRVEKVVNGFVVNCGAGTFVFTSLKGLHKFIDEFFTEKE